MSTKILLKVDTLPFTRLVLINLGNIPKVRPDLTMHVFRLKGFCGGSVKSRSRVMEHTQYCLHM